MLALVLGLVVSAGLYFAYLWPSVEPVDEEVAPAAAAASDAPAAPDAAAPPGDPAVEQAPEQAAAT